MSDMAETTSETGRYYPDMPPMLPSENSDTYTNRLTALPDVAQDLTDRLWALGREYGPLGVALVAAQLTDSDVVVAMLTAPERAEAGEEVPE